MADESIPGGCVIEMATVLPVEATAVPAKVGGAAKVPAIRRAAAPRSWVVRITGGTPG